MSLHLSCHLLNAILSSLSFSINIPIHVVFVNKNLFLIGSFYSTSIPYPLTLMHFCPPPVALGVQQPSLLGASPSLYSQQSALAAASLSTQSAANYQISQQTAALQQQAAAAAAAALQQVSHREVILSTTKPGWGRQDTNA